MRKPKKLKSTNPDGSQAGQGGPPFFNILRIRVPNYVAKQRAHHEKTSGLYCILIEKPKNRKSGCCRLI